MARLLTGHEVFDYISDIEEGSTLLILDETGFESTIFLNALFKNAMGKMGVVNISTESLDTPFTSKRIMLDELTSITALSIEVERYRKEISGSGVVIHDYLPHIIIREEEDRVLKMIEKWQERGSKSKAVELFPIPKGSFPSFEKKLQALVTGTIFIRILGKSEEKYLSFQIVGSCKPEYHLEDFHFLIRDGELLVKWGDEFTSRLPKERDEIIKGKIEYFRKDMHRLIIHRGRESEPTGIYDKWLLTQLYDKRIIDVSILFPDKLDEILHKLAKWNVRGALKVEEDEEAGPPPRPIDVHKLSLKNRVALLLPTRIALLMLRRRIQTIPLKVYDTLRQSADIFISSQLPEKSLMGEFSELELYFQEMAARLTALETIKETKEDPRIKFDSKHLPKLISLAMYYGYRIKPKVKKIDEDEYMVDIEDCFICRDYTSRTPICGLLAGTIQGVCAITFKEKFVCKEVRCKSMGYPSCVFNIKMLLQAPIQSL